MESVKRTFKISITEFEDGIEKKTNDLADSQRFIIMAISNGIGRTAHNFPQPEISQALDQMRWDLVYSKILEGRAKAATKLVKVQSIPEHLKR